MDAADVAGVDAAIPRSVLSCAVGKLLDFAEAIEDSEGLGSRSLLLGNGFSMAWNADKFSYSRLLDRADLTDLLVSKERLFPTLETSDFEEAMASLDSAGKLANIYEYDTFADELHHDSSTIRNGLSDALSSVHPLRSTDLSDAELTYARGFLSNFSRYYTLNYDLLLYWVLNSTSRGNGPMPDRDDGFRRDSGGLSWDESNAFNQNVYYLHGAFHLYTGTDGNTRKLAYEADAALITQVREAIERREYPLVITEGRSDQKLRSVNRNPYLRFCHRSLQAAGDSLFVLGVKMSANDRHIFSHLERPSSKVTRLYVCLHGSKSANVDIVGYAVALSAKRKENGGKKLRVKFFSSESARVWR